jgi:hypothetical protein
MSAVDIGRPALRLVPTLLPESAAGDRLFFDDGTIALSRWGGWRLNAAEQALQFDVSDQVTYSVDLLGCDQSAAVLDALVRVSGRVWLPDMSVVVAGLLRAFDDVLALSLNVCGWGAHQVMAGAQIREAIFRFTARFHEGERP